MPGGNSAITADNSSEERWGAQTIGLARLRLHRMAGGGDLGSRATGKARLLPRAATSRSAGTRQRLKRRTRVRSSPVVTADGDASANREPAGNSEGVNRRLRSRSRGTSSVRVTARRRKGRVTARRKGRVTARLRPGNQRQATAPRAETAEAAVEADPQAAEVDRQAAVVVATPEAEAATVAAKHSSSAVSFFPIGPVPFSGGRAVF